MIGAQPLSQARARHTRRSERYRPFSPSTAMASSGVSDTTHYVGHGRLRGKVALVTGGSQAIGKTIVEVFAKEGAVVHFCGRHREPGEAVERFVREQGGEAHFAVVDVGVEAQLKRWIDACGAREGRIDVMLPNAAAFVFGKIDDVTSEDWDTVRSGGYANCVVRAVTCARAAGRWSSWRPSAATLRRRRLCCTTRARRHHPADAHLAWTSARRTSASTRCARALSYARRTSMPGR